MLVKLLSGSSEQLHRESGGMRILLYYLDHQIVICTRNVDESPMQFLVHQWSLILTLPQIMGLGVEFLQVLPSSSMWSQEVEQFQFQMVTGQTTNVPP